MKTRRHLFTILALLCFLSLFLFLGNSDFHTRGEPREALVAQAMIAEGNWTLPTTNGTDIAYKPPLFHWTAAAVSVLTGEVDEYTARVPSALALTLMVLAGFMFYAKRKDPETAFLAAFITLTNFEVHRAGVACRVDMLLAALMVLSLYALYHWAVERRMKGVPVWGILCLSGAFLTKGPVGVVLPCGVVAVMLLIRGGNFGRIFLRFAGVGLASCILPALWYFAAWRQGGETFLQLVLEENVLRFLGKMTYASHENPWPYNVMTVVTGFVPYTLLLLFSLCTLKTARISGKPRQWWEKLRTAIRQMDDSRLFSLLSIVVMFVFYCIPKSKRSVYLLPIYPFIAYFIAEYMVWLVKRSPKPVRWYNNLLCTLGVALTVIFTAVRCGLVPHSIFQGKRAAENLAYLDALETLPLTPANLMIVLAPLAVAVIYRYRPQYIAKDERKRLALTGAVMAFALFFALDGVYQPAILNVKSNKSIARRIEAEAPDVPVYSYITRTEPGNRMHPFTLNFYLGGRIVPFIDFAPQSGILLLDEEEYDGFVQRYGNEYTLEEWPDSRFKSNDNREMTRIYRFQKP